ncbi:hypothetical protein RvY_16867 [Ramazzottius varieornatus]|uniref:RRM domain-containing protein n=1 Tax=Ramazzottius varieornatus TaxID=947166 RepID=A0A1D1W0P7_RAMVA|nr:hypothetical protein RvY_16867 [Ramazzottius varieornatus]
MADEKKGTGKKDKKGKKVVMSLDQFIAAPVVEDVIDWAAELDQNLPMNRNYGSSSAPVALPSGPRSMMGGPDIDYDVYSHVPPFYLVMDNAPFDVTEFDIIKFFGKEIHLKEVIPSMEFGGQRNRLAPRVEFETRDMMIKALQEKQNTTFIKRTVNLKTLEQMIPQNQDVRSGKYGSRDFQRRPEDGPDPTLGQWRTGNDSGPMQHNNMPPPERDFANLRDRPGPPSDMGRPPFNDNRQNMNMRDRAPMREPGSFEITRNQNIPPPAQNFSRQEPPRDFEFRRGGPSFERAISREGSEFSNDGSSARYSSAYGHLPPPGWDGRARPSQRGDDRNDMRRSHGPPQSARDGAFRTNDFSRGREDVVIERRSSNTMMHPPPPMPPPINNHVITRDRPPNFEQEQQQIQRMPERPEDFRGRSSDRAPPPRYPDRHEPPRHQGDIRRSSFEQRDHHQNMAPPREPPRINKAEEPAERPKLILAPRAVDTSSGATQITVQPPSAIFGGAKPVDTLAKEREIEEKIQRDLAAAAEEAERKKAEALKAKELATAPSAAKAEGNAEGNLQKKMSGLSLNNQDGSSNFDRRNNNNGGHYGQHQQRGGFHNSNSNNRNDQNKPVSIVRPQQQNANADANLVHRSSPAGNFKVAIPPRHQQPIDRQLSDVSGRSQDKLQTQVSGDGEEEDNRKVSGGDGEEEEEEAEEEDGFTKVTNHKKERSSNQGQFTGSRVFTPSARGGRGRGSGGGMRGAPGPRRPYQGGARGGTTRGSSNVA